MKYDRTWRRWVLPGVLFAAAITVRGAEDPALRVKLEDPQPDYKNRFGVSYSMGFNVTAQFKNVANAGQRAAGAGPGPDPAKGNRVDRDYDDGYVHANRPQNEFGLTAAWGVKNESQLSGNDTAVMHSTTARPIDTKTIDSDPQHGVELTYNRELGRGEKNRWGLESAFGWSDIEIRDHRPLAGKLRVVTDTYGLGIDPHIGEPNPDYPGWVHAGTGTKPGESLIKDVPESRSISNSPASVTGKRRFDGNLFAFRFGPYVDMPIDDKWTASFSAGVAVGVIEGEFRFREQFSSGGSRAWQTGSGQNTDAFVGGFLNATIRYAIDEHWGVFVGGQYLGLAGCFSAKAAGQKIELDFARTAFFTAGFDYTF